MEPFTSATTVLTVLGMTLKVSQQTYAIVQGIRAAPVQVQRLAIELQDLYSLLAMFQLLLDRSLEDTGDTVIKMLDNLQKVLENCLLVLKDVRTSLSPFVRPDGSPTTGFWRSVQYAAFKRSDIVVLQQSLGSYRSMLNMSYSALNVMYASETHATAIKLDDNTLRFDARLEDVQVAVKRLEHQIDRKELEEQRREEQLQSKGLSADVAVQNDCGSEVARRLTISKYSAPLRESIRSFESIISTPPVSRTATLVEQAEDQASLSKLPSGPIIAETLVEMDEVEPSPGEEDMSIQRQANDEEEQIRVRMSDGLMQDIDFIMGSGLKLNTLRPSDASVWDEADADPDMVFVAQAPIVKSVMNEDKIVDLNKLALETQSPQDFEKSYRNSLWASDQDLDLPLILPGMSGIEPPSPTQADSENLFDKSSKAEVFKELNNQPLKELTQFLKARVLDWKGHNINNFGPLLLCDAVSIERDHNGKRKVHNVHHCFLFEERLICCKPVSSKVAMESYSWKPPPAEGNESSKEESFAYKLKGRILMEDIKSIKRPGLDVEIFWGGDGGDEGACLKFNDAGKSIQWAVCLGIQAQLWSPVLKARPVIKKRNDE